MNANYSLYVAVKIAPNQWHVTIIFGRFEILLGESDPFKRRKGVYLLSCCRKLCWQVNGKKLR